MNYISLISNLVKYLPYGIAGILAFLAYFYINGLKAEIKSLEAENVINEVEIEKLKLVIEKQNISIKEKSVDIDALNYKIHKIETSAKVIYRAVDKNQSCEDILENKLKIFTERLK